MTEEINEDFISEEQAKELGIHPEQVTNAEVERKKLLAEMENFNHCEELHVATHNLQNLVNDLPRRIHSVVEVFNKAGSKLNNLAMVDQANILNQSDIQMQVNELISLSAKLRGTSLAIKDIADRVIIQERIEKDS